MARFLQLLVTPASEIHPFVALQESCIDKNKMSYPAPEFSDHVASGISHDVIKKLGTCVQLMSLKFTSSYKHICNLELVLD